MTNIIGCSELGIKDCEFKASGETAGDIARKVIEHLRTEHRIDMPDADAILAGRMSDDPLEPIDPAVALVVDRLTEALNIVPPQGPELPTPTIGTMPSG